MRLGENCKNMSKQSQPKELREVSVTCQLEAEEAVVELMHREFDIPPSVFAVPERNETKVSVYLEDVDGFPTSTRRKLQKELEFIGECGLNVEPWEINTRKIENEDWAESWKKHFHPIHIGDKLLIKPDWSDEAPKDGQQVVILNPGLSFGTGQHPTTLYCLEEIVEALDKGSLKSFIDIGTGSGILAISAAKLGVEQILGIDFDPEAIRIASENGELNKVDSLLEFRVEDLTEIPKRGLGKYDLVCANLIFDLLISERQRIVNHVGEGGRLVLAGILERQYPRVAEAFEQVGFKEVASRELGEWKSGTFERA